MDRGLKPRKTTPGNESKARWLCALVCRLEASLGNDDTFEANYRRLINAHYRRWLACGSVRYRRCAIKNLGHADGRLPAGRCKLQLPSLVIVAA